jgi:hypothetical protein
LLEALLLFAFCNTIAPEPINSMAITMTNRVLMPVLAKSLDSEESLLLLLAAGGVTSVRTTVVAV